MTEEYRDDGMTDEEWAAAKARAARHAAAFQAHLDAVSEPGPGDRTPDPWYVRGLKTAWHVLLCVVMVPIVFYVTCHRPSNSCLMSNELCPPLSCAVDTAWSLFSGDSGK